MDLLRLLRLGGAPLGSLVRLGGGGCCMLNTGA